MVRTCAQKIWQALGCKFPEIAAALRPGTGPLAVLIKA